MKPSQLPDQRLRRTLAAWLLLPFVLATNMPSAFALRTGLEGREQEISRLLQRSSRVGLEEDTQNALDAIRRALDDGQALLVQHTQYGAGSVVEIQQLKDSHGPYHLVTVVYDDPTVGQKKQRLEFMLVKQLISGWAGPDSRTRDLATERARATTVHAAQDLAAQQIRKHEFLRGLSPDPGVELHDFEQLKRLEALKVIAHGFGDDGPRKMVSSMLDGAILPSSQTGRQGDIHLNVVFNVVFYDFLRDDPHGDWYGPDFAILDARSLDSDSSLRPPNDLEHTATRIPNRYVKFYIVSSGGKKEFIIDALQQAVQLELIPQQQRESLQAKVFSLDDIRRMADEALRRLVSFGPAGGLEEIPMAIETTVLPPWSVNPFPPAPEGALRDRARELFVTDPLSVYYTTSEVGAQAAALIQAADHTLPGFTLEGVQLVRLTPDVAPAKYTVILRAAGDPLPNEAALRAAYVAVIALTPDLTVPRLIQQALAQWTGRPVGDVLSIESRDGRLGIYV